jgi:hypothetical protein
MHTTMKHPQLESALAQVQEIAARVVEEWGLLVSNDRLSVLGKRERFEARLRQRQATEATR